MKPKLIIFSTFFAFFISCKDANQHAGHTGTETVHQQDHQSGETFNHDEHGDMNGSVLALNNGAKWKSDDPTNRHARKLVELNGEFRAKSADANLEMFRNYADMLRQELNGMIKDCKMEGPDHDALHLWLEPVLHGVRDLKNADNADDARKIESLLSENITQYNQFFN